MPMSPRLLRPQAAVSAGFDPRAISGLAVWYDAADAGSVTLNGSNVAELRDKSGNGKHMAQSTAANQPAYVAAGQNGRSVIRTAGGAVHLRRESGGSVLQESMSFLGETAHTIFAAVRASSIQTNGHRYLYWAINPASSANRLQLSGPGSVAPVNYVIDSGNFTQGRINGPSFSSPTPAVSSTAAHIVGFRRDGSEFFTFLNGTASATASRTSAPAVNFSGTYSLFNWINAVGAPQDQAFDAGWQGDLFEIVHYNRALTTRERDQVLGYLGQKWGVTTTLSNPPSVSNAEASDWIDRVYANGGTVSASTAAAVNTFCNSINAESGLRAAILRCNLFCGNSDANLAAVRTPLYLSGSFGGATLGNAMDTNVNFAQADYQETGSGGGLKGNGTTKYLNTGFNYNSLASANSTHLSCSGTDFETTGERAAIGQFIFPGDLTQLLSLDVFTSGGGGRGYRSSSVGPAMVATPGTTIEAHIIGTRTSTALNTLYRTGVSAATNTATSAPTVAARAFFVFAANNNGTPNSYTAARLRMYSIGNGLTAAQALAFSNAVVAFNAALGRA